MEVIGWTIVLSICAIILSVVASFIYSIWSVVEDDYYERLRTWEYADALHQQKLHTLGMEDEEDE